MERSIEAFEQRLAPGDATLGTAADGFGGNASGSASGSSGGTTTSGGTETTTGTESGSTSTSDGSGSSGSGSSGTTGGTQSTSGTGTTSTGGESTSGSGSGTSTDGSTGGGVGSPLPDSLLGNPLDLDTGGTTTGVGGGLSNSSGSGSTGSSRTTSGGAATGNSSPDASGGGGGGGSSGSASDFLGSNSGGGSSGGSGSAPAAPGNATSGGSASGNSAPSAPAAAGADGGTSAPASNSAAGPQTDISIPTHSLDDWTISEHGGHDPGRGSVVIDVGALKLSEGNSFDLTAKRTVTIPSNPGRLTFRYRDLDFASATDSEINDAFEVALVGSNGKSLIPTYAARRDSFFNITAGQGVAKGNTTTLDEVNQRVSVDISALPAGTQGTLIFRLVNNDQSTTTSVSLLGDVQAIGVTTQLANDTAPVDSTDPAYLSDGITTDSTLTGSLVGDVAQLQVQQNGGAFTDITASIVAGQFQYQPANLTAGPQEFTFRATSGTGDTLDSMVSFTYSTGPTPVISPATPVTEGSTVLFDSALSTIAGAAIYQRTWLMPNGATVSGTTAEYPFAESGIYPVRLTLVDIAGATRSVEVPITVTNMAPTITVDTSTVAVNEGQQATNTGTWSDIGQDVVTLTSSLGMIAKDANGTWSWSLATTGNTPTSQVVTVTATDSNGAASSTVFTLIVNNQAPVLHVNSPAVTVNEGQTAGNSGTWSYPGQSVVTLTSSLGTITKRSNGTWLWSYVTNGSTSATQTVTITAATSNGSVTTKTFTLTVNNLAPVLAVHSSCVTVNEGSTATNTGTWSDISPDVVTLTSSVGMVTKNANGTWLWSWNTTDGPDQSQTVTITATDNDGAVRARTFSLKVNDVPRTFSISGNATVAEGVEYELNLSTYDPGNDPVNIQSWTVNWGDGVTVTYPGNPGVVQHTYADGTIARTIKASVNVTSGPTPARMQKTVTVTNVAPSVTATASHASAVKNAAFSGSLATFTDPGFTSSSAGTQETFTARVNWGDGTGNQAATLTFTPGSIGSPSTGTVSGLHTYLAVGSFIVTVTVMDDDNAVGTATFTMTVNQELAAKFTVVDQSDKKFYQYSSSYQFIRTVPLNSNNTVAQGVTSNPTGSRFWVIDNDKKVYVYDQNGGFLGRWQANGIKNPEDITTDGTNLWIVAKASNNGNGYRLYYFQGGASWTGSTGNGQPVSYSCTATYTLNSSNQNPVGLTYGKRTVTTANGPVVKEQLWVTDNTGCVSGNGNSASPKVFMYNLSGNTDGQWTLDSGNTTPMGITVNPAGGNDMWVVDRHDSKIYYYAGAINWTSGTHSATTTPYNLASGNDDAEGIVDPIGTTITWKGGATGNWNTASNWTGDVVPGPDDSVVIPAGATVTIDYDPSDPNNSVTVNSLDVSGELFIQGDTSDESPVDFTISGPSTVSGTLTLQMANLHGSGNLAVSGSLFWNDGKIDGTGTLTIASGGNLTLGTGGISIQKLVGKELGRALNNSGTVIVGHRVTLMDTSTIVNQVSAVFDIRDSVYGPTSSFTNHGTLRRSVTSTAAIFTVPLSNFGAVNVEQGTLQASSPVTNSGGSVNIAAGATLTVVGAAFVQTAGTTTLSGGILSSDQAIQIQGGQIQGIGTISADLTNSGIIQPGSPYGVLTITGNYVQSSTGMLAVTAAGPVAGVAYGQLVVQGTVSLGGQVQFHAIYPTQTGDVFCIVDGRSSVNVSGHFSGLPEGEYTELGGHLYQVSYSGGTGNDVVLQSTVPPISISSISHPQATSGIVDYEFTVTLGRPAAIPLTYRYQTHDLTAIAGRDYFATEGNILFAPGQTSATITVHVPGNPVGQLTRYFQFVARNVLDLQANEVHGIGTIEGTLVPPGFASSVGKDFWMTFHKPRIEENPNTTTLFISSVAGATGFVEVPGLQFTQSWTVGANQVVSVTLPNSVIVETADGIEYKGIHVVSNDNDISVSGLHHSPFITDGFTAISTETLGKEYRVLTYGNVGVLNGTDFTFVATQDNTAIQITPGPKSTPLLNGFPTLPYVAGVPYTVTLNAGQTYQLRSVMGDDDGGSSIPSFVNQADFTGTRILADKPVAMFAGHSGANVPGGSFFVDELIEQMLPVRAWGNQYFSVPLALRTGGDTFRVLADQDGTVVAINGAVVATLNAGEFYETRRSTASVFTANYPILVAQFSNSSSFDGQLGDPFMMLLTPTNGFSRSFTVTTPTWNQFGQYDPNRQMIDPQIFLNLVVPTTGVSTITLNGVSVAQSLFTPIGTSGYSGAQIPLPSSHTQEIDYTIQSADPILRLAGYLYGMGVDDSFGFSAGFNVDQLILSSSLALTPASENVFVGAKAEVTAMVLDDHQQPLPGIPVLFRIAGSNSGSRVVYTDATGHAVYEYRGTAAGSDVITATVTTPSRILTDTAAKSWVRVLPMIEVDGPGDGSQFNANTAIIVNGQALAGRPEIPITSVTLNGLPVDTLDPAGNFFTRFAVPVGVTHLTFVATDVYGGTATTSIALTGVSSAVGTADQQSLVQATNFDGTYYRTSYDSTSHLLYADISLHNAGQYPLGKPLYVGVKNISDPTVQAKEIDGVLADGTPYYDFSRLVAQSQLLPGGDTGIRTISFLNPLGNHFTYDLILLGDINLPPVFNSLPVVDGIEGQAYQYQASVTDPDDSSFDYDLISGPEGMSISASGSMTWTPTAGQSGTYSVMLSASDGHGGEARQHFVLTVSLPTSNRPPLFTSLPTLTANVLTDYQYAATATDADRQPLTFAVIEGPQGFHRDEALGVFAWSPTASQTGPQRVTIAVSDGQGGIARQSFVVQVIAQEGNTPPVIDADLTTFTRIAGVEFRYQVRGLDADGDLLTYHLITAPSGMQIDSATGMVSWKPSAVSSGPQTFVAIVTDGRGGMAEQSYTLTIVDTTPGSVSGVVFNDLDADGIVDSGESGLAGWVVYVDQNHDRHLGEDEPSTVTADGGNYTFTSLLPDSYRVEVVAPNGWFRTLPVIGGREITVTPGQLVSGQNFGAIASIRAYAAPVVTPVVNLQTTVKVRLIHQVDAVSPDGLPLTFRMTYGPAGTVVDPTSGTVFVTPTSPGSFQIAVQVDDGHGNIRGQVIHVTANYEDQAPVITSTPTGPAIAGRAWQYQVTAQDVEDGPNLVYSLPTGPAWLSLDPVNGVLTGTPPAGQESSDEIVVQVADRGGNFTQQSIQLSVVVPVVNLPPEIISEPTLTATVNQDWQYQIVASDPNGNSLTYELQAAPAWLTMTTAGLVQGQPTSPGTVHVALRVSDSLDGFATQSFDIDVTSTATVVNPVFDSTPTGPALVGRSYQYQMHVTDLSGTPVVYSIVTGPAGMSVDPVSGLVTWTPLPIQAGSQHVELKATNGTTGSATQIFDLPVSEIISNAAPDITSHAPGPAVVGQPYVYQVLAEDPNGDALTWRLDRAPQGMSISATGLVTWTPLAGQVGTAQIVLAVSDGRGGEAIQTVNLPTVAQSINSVPVITSTPTIEPLVGGHSFVYQVVATDTDGDPLSYIMESGFTGMAMDSATGLFTWTPPLGAFGTYAVNLAVSDGRGGIARQPLTLTVIDTSVTGTNHAPTISSHPRGPALLQQNWQYQVVAADADGDGLTYQVSGGNGNIGISSTGLLTWTPATAGSYPIVVTVADGRGLSIAQSFDLQVIAVSTNTAPTITSEPTGPAVVGSLFEYQVLAHDAEQVSLTYSLGSHPAGMTIDGNGKIEWTPDTSQANSHSVEVIVNDGVGGTASQQFSLLAIPDGTANPVVITSVPTGPAYQSQLYLYQATVTGLSGTNITWQVSGGNGNLAISSNGRLTWDPASIGTYPLTITVSDTSGHVATQTFDLQVVSVTTNLPPTITSSPIGPAIVGLPWEYQVAAQDPNGNPLTYALGNHPAGMTIDADGKLHWTPTAAQVQEYPVEILVSDGIGGVATQSFNLSAVLNAPNDAPVITSAAPEGNIETGHLFQYVATAIDANSDPLTWHLDSGFSGMTLNTDTGLLKWTPSPGQFGRFQVSLSVTDGRAGIDRQSFDIVVIDPAIVTTNYAPAISSTAPGPAIVGRAYQYQIVATDQNGDALSYALTTKPSGMAIASSGLVTWTPGSNQVGVHSILITVSDGRGGAATQEFSLAALADAPNTAPVFTSTPTGPAIVGVAYQYRATATDVNGDPVSFRLQVENPPAGMQLNGQTGLLTWTPTASQTGTQTITIVAVDGRGGETPQSFNLPVTVLTENHSPVIGSTAPTQVVIGQSYFYAMQATDLDNDQLTYAFTVDAGQNPIAPTGMAINTLGRVTWSPVITDVGPHNVSLTVSDGQGGSAIQTFVINVSSVAIPNSGSPPVITSTPGLYGLAGQAYAYNAQAIDADGGTLLWSLTAAPVGMSINAATGTIRWTPTTGQTGLQNIEVRVTDSTGQSAVQRYGVVVNWQAAPPVVTTTPSTIATHNQPYMYMPGATTTTGVPLTYSLVSGPAGMQINSVTGAVSWTPSDIGSFAVSLRVTDTLGQATFQGYSIAVNVAAPVLPPVILTQPVTDSIKGQVYQQQIVATDPQGQTIEYFLGTHPAQLTMTPSGLIEWTPGTTGSAVIEVIAKNQSQKTSTLRYTLIIHNDQPPVILPVTSGPVTAGTTYRTDLLTNTSGEPITYVFDQAPLGMQIDNPGRISWPTTVAEIGAHHVIVRAISGAGLSSLPAEFDVNVTADQQAPVVVVRLTSDRVEIGSPVTVLVSAADNVGVTGRTLKVDGNLVTLDASGRATFTYTQPGAISFLGEATDAAGNVGTGTKTLIVYDPAITNNPTGGLSLGNNLVLTQPTDIIGTVSDPVSIIGLSYTLSLIPQDGGTVRILGTGSGPVTDGTLGTIDTTNVRNGQYTLVLSITNAGGNTSSYSRDVEIATDLKLGNFTMSFTDLSVTVGSLAIVVSRSYNSLDADIQGEFGYGWKLDLSNTKIEVKYPGGASLSSFEGNLPPFKDGTRVVVTLPSGKREGFTFYGVPGMQYFGTVFDWIPRFFPDTGVTSKLITDETRLMKTGNGEYLDTGSNHAYNPADSVFGGSYVLQLRNGTELAINAKTGDLASITDLVGNQLEFTGQGIESGNTHNPNAPGRKVDFEYDTAGRILAVIDPAGKRIEYSYDGAGDLVAVTDRANATTTFTYRSDVAHYLDQIIDPLGRSAAQTQYDNAGRVTKVTDADGKTIETEYGISGRLGPDASARLQRITDQLGNISYVLFDVHGNSIREEDPVGGITKRTFDSEHRLLTQTTVIGLEDSATNGETNDLTTTNVYDTAGNLITRTDARGLSSHSTFNEYGQPTSHTDVYGNTTVTSYDSRGLPISVRDVNGNTTRLKFDNQGNPTEIKDHNGNLLVRNSYNSYGDVLSSTPIAGRTTYFDYDINGNQVASWYFGGTSVDEVQILGVTKYDELNRVVASTQAVLPTGSFLTANFTTATIDPQYVTSSTSTVYNLTGQVVSTTDANGFQTRNMYDLRGQLIETRQETLDINDNPAMLVSRTALDDIGRPIAQTQPYLEGSTDPIRGTLNTYDAAGRVILTEQVLGLIITITGAVNNQQAAVSSEGTVISSSGATYATSGRMTSSVDSYGLISQTTYNAFGNVTETRHESFAADGSSEWLVTRTIYDNFGRAVITTDSYLEGTTEPIAGTRTLYDNLGRATTSRRLSNILIVLVDGETSLSSAPLEVSQTQTSFDSDGRVAVTTDTYGRETHTIYDSLGRVTETRRQANDENGSTVWLVSRTVYDNLGRVDVSTETFVDGQTTIYGNRTEYDVQGRAVKSLRLEGVGINLNATTGDATLISAGTTLFATETVYDFEGRVFRQIGPDGQVTEYEYDALDRQVAMIGPADVIDGVSVRLRSETVYDAQGRTVAQRTNISQFADDTIDDSDMQTTTHEFDSRGDIVKTTYADSTFVLMTYDDRGRKLTETNQMGLTRTFAYDSQDRLASVTLPDLDGSSATTNDIATYNYGYDARGNQTLLVDPLGRETRWTFDDLGRETSRTLPLGFGADGKFGTADDPAVGQASSLPFTETMTYDVKGRMSLQTSFEGVITQFIYDDDPTLGLTVPAVGRLHEKRFYDDATAYADGAGTPSETWSYTFDAFGRELTATQSTGTASMTVTNTYDDQGQLTAVSSPVGVIGYSYDNLGRLIQSAVFLAGANSLIDMPQRTTSFTYDPLGRLESVVEDRDASVTSDALLSTNYAYDLLGNLDRTLLPNNILEDYEYDSLNRLDSLTHYKTDGTVADLADLSDNDKVAEFDYTLQADGTWSGLLETFWENSGGAAVTNNFAWQYDNLGRLTRENLDSTDDALDSTSTYSYDLTGNRTQSTRDTDRDGTVDETVHYTIDANDRLTQESTSYGKTTTYGYDHTQQTSKTVTPADGSSVESFFTYDLQGRMETVTMTTRDTYGVAARIERTTYDYDVKGLRISALQEINTDADSTWNQRTRTEFLVDHNNHTGYQQVVRETHYDADTGLITKTADYSFGHDEITQTTRQYDAGGHVISSATLVFGHDGHGNVRVLTDLAVAVVQMFVYDAYGQMLAIYNGAGTRISGGNGAFADASVALTNLLYSGEQFDMRIGQQYLRARYYDAATGTFNRLDPFFGNTNNPQSFHKYLYTHGDPVNGVDPTGKFSLGTVMAAGAIGGGLAGGYSAAVTGRNVFGGIILGSLAGAAAAAGVFYAVGSLALFATAVGGAGLGGFTIGAVAGIDVAALISALQLLAIRSAIEGQVSSPPSSERVRYDYDYAQLSLDVYDGDDLRTESALAANGWIEERDFRDDNYGYHARLYRNNRRNEMVMVYEGTNPPQLADWFNNAAQGFGFLGEGFQYTQAKADAEYVEQLAIDAGLPLRFTGHSLGGGLATAAALHTNKTAVTFNAAGVNSRTTSTSAAASLITNYRVKGEVLSTVQDSQLGGWLMPNSSVGETYWLTPEADTGWVYRHTFSILRGMEDLF